jgi:K+-sensing histidine kinase KdpD
MPSKLREIARYGFAIAVVSIAFGASLILRAPLGNPFWLFFQAAVVASTWFGGKGPGWVAVGLSMLVVLYFFTPPLYSWKVNLQELPSFIAFIFCQLATNWLFSWRMQADQ